MYKNVSCVYALIFTTQQGTHHFYIGETQDYKRRISEHLSAGTKHVNHRLATAFKRFGQPVTVILKTEEDRNQRLEIENLYISKFKATLNLRMRGQYGLMHCVEGKPVSFDEYMGYELCNDWGCPDNQFCYQCAVRIKRNKGQSTNLKAKKPKSNYEYRRVVFDENGIPFRN
jgi:predicted GIY-YIG superfamily endonuclease